MLNVWSAVLLVGCVSIVSATFGDVPTQSQIDWVHQLEQMNMIPWPHGHSGGQYIKLNATQRQSLGSQYFPNLPSYGPSSYQLATVLYDWSQPDYVRMQFPLTVPGNVTAMEAFINYWPIGAYPYVPAMFNLTGLTQQENNQQLEDNFATVNEFCAAETALIQYALSQLPSKPYSQLPMLYRGGGREVEFFCNQFNGGAYGSSVDDCVANQIYDGAALQVNPFWSTTSDLAVTQHYRGGVQYYIQPSPNRNGWVAREIEQFSIDQSAIEYLYPHGSWFRVISATCVNDFSGTYWNITLQELSSDDTTHYDESWASPAAPTVCLGSSYGAFVADDGDRYSRYNDGLEGGPSRRWPVAALVVPVAVLCVIAVAIALVRHRRRRGYANMEGTRATPMTTFELPRSH